MCLQFQLFIQKAISYIIAWLTRFLTSNCSISGIKDDSGKVRKAFQTLFIYVRNVAKKPDEEKFRKIRFSNPLFQVKFSNPKCGLCYKHHIVITARNLLQKFIQYSPWGPKFACSSLALLPRSLSIMHSTLSNW